MLTADISASLHNGDLSAETEIAINYGNGDIEGGFENISVLSFGATANLGLQISKLRLGLGGGFAQGDSNPDDENINTFSFNRDYNVALMMFEEPMPILRSTNSSDRDYSLPILQHKCQRLYRYRNPPQLWHIRLVAMLRVEGKEEL